MRRNVNPKSLKGREQIDRVRELMGKMQPLNESTSLSELELVKKGPNNVIYGIVRENHKYFIKTTTKTSGNIVAEDFDYIGGLQNKFSEAYNSYAAATKQLNLKFDMLNESLGIKTHNNILESDGIAAAGYGFVVEEEEIEEDDKPDFLDLDKDGDKKESMKKAAKDAKNESDEEKLEEKTVLKVDVPAPAEPEMEEPVEDEVPMDEPIEDEVPMDDEMGMEEPAMDDEGDDEEDSTKKIQKLTGKIGQAIRELDEPDAELEKYVINSIISALHLDEFSDEDIEDIIAKLEGEEEEDEAEADDFGGEEMDMEEPAMEEEPAEEEEMEMTEESVVYTKSQLVESLTKKILKESIEEHHMGDSSPAQYDREAYITEEDFDESKSLYEDCHECIGMDCPNCGGIGYTLIDGDFDVFDSEPEEAPRGGGIANDFMALDTATGRQRPTDRNGNEIPNDIDSYQKPNKYDDTQEEMFEDDGYGVDVFDSISADFDSEPEEAPRGGGIANDFMALDTATGRQRPTDRDGNEIPNDIDSYQKPNKYDDLHGNDSSVNDFDSISSGFDDDMDGIRKGLDADEFDKPNYFNDISRKGDNMGYDIKYFRSKTDVRGGDTTTKPKTKEPITTPKPKRGPWTTPTTVPNPQTTPKAKGKGNKKGNNTPKPKRLGRIGYYK